MWWVDRCYNVISNPEKNPKFSIIMFKKYECDFNSIFLLNFNGLPKSYGKQVTIVDL